MSELFDPAQLERKLPNYTYTVTSNMIQRDQDGAFIPIDPNNSDYQMYLKITGQVE